MDSQAAGDVVAPASGGRQRPVPVTILAVLQVVLGVLSLAVAAALLLDPSLASALSGLIDRSAYGFIEGRVLIVVVGLVGMLELISAGLLLQLRQTGWTLAMLLSGINLGVQIFSYVSAGTLTTLSLVLNVVSVLYLNQGTVREAFGLVPAGHGALEDERG